MSISSLIIGYTPFKVHIIPFTSIDQILYIFCT